MANIIRLPEVYAANTAYSRVKEGMQLIGEEVLAFDMFHINDKNDNGSPLNWPRCACYNEYYNQTQDITCPYCYGTTFQGGVRSVWRIWANLSDDRPGEEFNKTGIWNKEGHSSQFEPFPVLEDNDYILRVRQWDDSKAAPVILGSFYKLTNVQPITVSTGNRYRTSNSDRMAQTAEIMLLPPEASIYQFDVRTEITFPRYDGQVR